jgi:response regulator of citrate/malate metabolism
MTIKVGIIEDDLETRRILTGWIRNAAGFMFVGEWNNTEAAMAQLPATAPDVVLVDIHLQAGSGFVLESRSSLIQGEGNIVPGSQNPIAQAGSIKVPASDDSRFYRLRSP